MIRGTNETMSETLTEYGIQGMYFVNIECECRGKGLFYDEIASLWLGCSGERLDHLSTGGSIIIVVYV